MSLRLLCRRNQMCSAATYHEETKSGFNDSARTTLYERCRESWQWVDVHVLPSTTVLQTPITDYSICIFHCVLIWQSASRLTAEFNMQNKRRQNNFVTTPNRIVDFFVRLKVHRSTEFTA